MKAIYHCSNSNNPNCFLISAVHRKKGHGRGMSNKIILLLCGVWKPSFLFLQTKACWAFCDWAQVDTPGLDHWPVRMEGRDIHTCCSKHVSTPLWMRHSQSLIPAVLCGFPLKSVLPSFPIYSQGHGPSPCKQITPYPLSRGSFCVLQFKLDPPRSPCPLKPVSHGGFCPSCPLAQHHRTVSSGYPVLSVT